MVLPVESFKLRIDCLGFEMTGVARHRHQIMSTVKWVQKNFWVKAFDGTYLNWISHQLVIWNEPKPKLVTVVNMELKGPQGVKLAKFYTLIIVLVGSGRNKQKEIKLHLYQSFLVKSFFFSKKN